MAKRHTLATINHKVAYELVVYDRMNDSCIGDWNKKVVWGSTLWGIAYAIMETLTKDGFVFELDFPIDGKQPIPKKGNTVRYYRDLCIRKDNNYGYYSTDKKGNDYYIEALISGRWVDIVKMTNVTDREKQR